MPRDPAILGHLLTSRHGVRLVSARLPIARCRPTMAERPLATARDGPGAGMRTARDGRDGTHRWRSATAVIGVAALLGFGVVAPVTAPALAASPPDTVDTGDPPPPADPTTPGGLEGPAAIPDETVVEVPPTAPGVVQGAEAALVAWLGTPDQRPRDADLLTLQAAVNLSPAGGTVSFDPGRYALARSSTGAPARASRSARRPVRESRTPGSRWREPTRRRASSRCSPQAS